jgi:hypothetical protein
MIKNNYLIIKNIHKDGLQRFYQKISFLFKKHCINFFYFNKKKINKRLTILRSPHVNKSARDQIEINTNKHFFIFNSMSLTNLFLYFLKKNAKDLFNFQYFFKNKQKIFFFFNI